MTISIISAMDKNRNIGLDGSMPWGHSMKADLAHFMKLTTGKTIIMGRKTFDSLGLILPNRAHIVLTKQDFIVKSPRVKTMNSIEEVLKYMENQPLDEEFFVIGGAQIYEQFLPHAERIYLTKIDAYLEGDTKFPQFEKSWRQETREDHFKDEKNPYDYSFLMYERVLKYEID